jgi:hypothetical protein
MRHGRKKSQRQRPDEMETTLKDSIHNSRRKEQSILKDLVPPRLQGVKKTVVPTRRLAAPVSTRLERDATTAVEGQMAAIPGALDVDASSVMVKLAALRSSVAAEPASASTSNWASKRDQPAPTPKVDPRRAKILARRKEVAAENAASRQAAEEKRAARRAAAAAAAAEEAGSGDDAEADPSASPMEKVRALAAKLPSVGKKAAATTAFKVLKAKIEADKEERVIKKAAKKAKAKAKAKAPPVEEKKKAGKKKGGPKKKKTGSKGWAPVRK